MTRWVRMLLGWLALCLALGAPMAFARAATPHVLAVTLVGPINPVAAAYVDRGIRAAEDANADAVLLQLDTPGGLDSAMRDIIQHMEASSVPVIVYVSPRGGRAASAGMYITEAADVAAMAPDTAIGAAHPVGGGGEDIKGTMGAKVTNDAAAYARGLAHAHGRNVRWVESAVRQSVSLNADEAVKQHVVDRVAPSAAALLEAIDGTHVKVHDADVVLHTRGATLDDRPMSGAEHFLYTLGNPELALILINLGVLGIIFELQNPTGLLAGIAGVLCLVVGLFAMGMLPVDGAGLALILFGLLLFTLELFVPSYGLLTAGGLIALILGGLMLFHTAAPGLQPALPFIVGVPATTGVLLLLGSALGLRAQRRAVQVGPERLLGREAEVRSALLPAGMVFLEGELWRAESSDRAPVAAGDRVVVERIDGLTLFVHKKAGEPGK